MAEKWIPFTNKNIDIEKLKDTALEVRRDILESVGRAGSGHIGGSLSAVELLVTLYMYRLRHDPTNPKWEDRDRFLLSKGHAAPALYSILSKWGYLNKDELKTLRQPGSRLQGHPEPSRLPGIEIPAGPEGIGLSEGIGMALAARMDGRERVKVYVMIGDGEMDEGEVWEAAMAAAKFKLTNLIVIIDKNGLQQEGTTKEIMPTDEVLDKWWAFGWRTLIIDGHNFKEIMSALDEADKEDEKPFVIIANTVKGKGVDFMEGNVKFHAPPLDKKTLGEALEKLRRV